jgi:hypothetical protein
MTDEELRDVVLRALEAGLTADQIVRIGKNTTAES